MGVEALAVSMRVLGGFVENMLRAVHSLLVNGDGVDLLLDDVRNLDFVGNLVRLEDFDFLLNWNFDVLNFCDLLHVVLVMNVIWNFSFDVFTVKERFELKIDQRNREMRTYTECPPPPPHCTDDTNKIDATAAKDKTCESYRLVRFRCTTQSFYLGVEIHFVS